MQIVQRDRAVERQARGTVAAVRVQLQVLDESAFELQKHLVGQLLGAGGRSGLRRQEGAAHHVQKLDKERQELSGGGRALLVGAEQNLDGGFNQVLGGEERCGVGDRLAVGREESVSLACQRQVVIVANSENALTCYLFLFGLFSQFALCVGEDLVARVARALHARVRHTEHGDQH